MNLLAQSDTPLVDSIDLCPKGFVTSSGRIVRLERALGHEHELHFVVYFADRSPIRSRSDSGELLNIAYDVGRLLARDKHSDPECFSLTMNGKKTGSWNDVEHINVYVFANREEKLASYKIAVDSAVDSG